jgi:hypothetical protein
MDITSNTASEVTYSATMEVEVTGSPGSYIVTCPDTYVGQGQKKVKLEWEMITEGWEILGIHGLPYPEFIDKSKDGIDYKCKDKNKTEKNYKYTIIVGSTTTEEVLVLDPTIKNGGI